MMMMAEQQTDLGVWKNGIMSHMIVMFLHQTSNIWFSPSSMAYAVSGSWPVSSIKEVFPFMEWALNERESGWLLSHIFAPIAPAYLAGKSSL